MGNQDNLRQNLGTRKKAICLKIGNNEVLTNESLLLDCLAFMYFVKDLDYSKQILEAKIQKECPYTWLRMLCQLYKLRTHLFSALLFYFKIDNHIGFSLHRWKLENT